MATVKDSIPHIVRTAEDPRQKGVWSARLSRIDQVNSKIRLLRLSLPRDGPPLRHLPGQYIDLYIPNVDVVGGFTITSPPQAASAQRQSQDEDPHIELAIQASPSNPPAAYLWRPVSEILDSTVTFRVGGNFAFPPLALNREECANIDRAVFIAGGVGINPIMSMISAMDEVGTTNKLGGMAKTVRVLYTARRESPEEAILFEKRLDDIAEKWKGNEQVDYKYTFFETSGKPDVPGQEGERKTTTGNSTTRFIRIKHDDLFEALGPEESRSNTVVYVCGLPAMTDEFVELLKRAPGMDEKRVLCEKWW
ncbi:hypothetical protein LTR99_001377 [Exophiala xenobiotica]|uniref:Oxidoreductase NAD-binding domain-containing protein 1 n=1 Tax=Vermiconidia calcicola TaxID=1690605 RepID=A0AAV9QPK2_9PEZI|nr:hypothetical protein LTR96_003292 [Exophiala xenobiotica]KAK5545939.1 hypothetical protein LTR25_000949 [Vermiconidia calcicola]KAK5549802.1 hypothetical protein LTR23_000093 [Chaetothyriales sp. CCFEE 6169]KAK5308402.1 hypothetical protein LTR99_001377 [Exophiala xenobiotica]KAK5342703.1 hypothetical protein LTR98_000329 [Exophiala xenobiotica]